MRRPGSFSASRPAPARTSGNAGSDLRIPVNLEAERSILGSILEAPHLVPDLIAINLRPEDFYLDAHRRIYQRILDLAHSSRPVDEVSLVEELQIHTELEQIGGLAYLIDLTYLVVPEKKHILYHAAIVMTKAKLRQIQQIGERAQFAAGLAGADPECLGRDLVGEVQTVLTERMS